MPKVVVKANKPGGGVTTKIKTLPYPSGKVGGYRAPVDTVGMDAEMKKTLGVIKPSRGPAKKPRKGR